MTTGAMATDQFAKMVRKYFYMVQAKPVYHNIDSSVGFLI